MKTINICKGITAEIKKTTARISIGEKVTNIGTSIRDFINENKITTVKFNGGGDKLKNISHMFEKC